MGYWITENGAVDCDFNPIPHCAGGPRRIATREERRQEMAEYLRKAPLMVRFTARVHDVVLEAYRKEAERTKGGKRSAEFWRLDDAIRYYRDRYDYYDSRY